MGWFGGKSFNPQTDVPDLSGKVILVTGGNAGLGKETILQLAQHNPEHIYMGARSADKARAAIDEIRKTVPDAPITHLSLDLTSFASIKACADTFTSQTSRLDLLYNNAGIMATPMGETHEGYEIQLGTNHMGHFLLTKLLLPTLLSTAAKPNADVRIVNLSSEGHNAAPIGGLVTDTKQLSTYTTWRRYGASKLCNILFAAELARRHPELTSVSLHPGVIVTGLYSPFRNSNVLARLGTAVFEAAGRLVLPDVKAGALNQIWAGSTAKENLVNGAYYRPVGALGGGSRDSKSEELARELWEWSSREVEAKGY